MLLVSVTPSDEAKASNWGFSSTGTGCIPDDATLADSKNHLYWYELLGSQMTTAQNAANATLNTSVSTVFDSSNNYYTDVVVYDQNYTTFCDYDWDATCDDNLWGLTTCVWLNAVGRCERHEVRYDTSDTAGFSSTQREGLACHENGHSVGLEHRNSESGCMYAFNLYLRTFTSHDRSHMSSL